MSEEAVRKRYAALDTQIKDLIPVEHLLSTKVVMTDQNLFDILLLVFPFVFDFVAILFDVPAFIWYGWLQVLAENDHCTEEPYDKWT